MYLLCICVIDGMYRTNRSYGTGCIYTQTHTKTAWEGYLSASANSLKLEVAFNEHATVVANKNCKQTTNDANTIRNLC